MLNLFLWLGGLPPVISGICIVLNSELYTGIIATNIVSLCGNAWPYVSLWLQLQGGDAFVGGMGRIIVAQVGNLRTKKLVAFVGIFHSLFEIWLLPTKSLPSCEDKSLGCT